MLCLIIQSNGRKEPKCQKDSFVKTKPYVLKDETFVSVEKDERCCDIIHTQSSVLFNLSKGNVNAIL